MYKNNRYRCPRCGKNFTYNTSPSETCQSYIDYGPRPIVFDIHEATNINTAFRSALWTGNHLQLTVMCINPGEDIGAEVHPSLDQFIRIEEGIGMAMFGTNENCFDYNIPVNSDYAVIIPAGTYHNIINTGNTPLKVYSIYAPPAHPFGTIHETKADAMKHSRH